MNYILCCVIACIVIADCVVIVIAVAIYLFCCFCLDLFGLLCCSFCLCGCLLLVGVWFVRLNVDSLGYLYWLFNLWLCWVFADWCC